MKKYSISFIGQYFPALFIFIFLTGCNSDDKPVVGDQRPTAPSSLPALVLEKTATGPSNNPTPMIKVTGVKAGAMVTLYRDSSCDTKISDPKEVGNKDEALISSYDLSKSTHGHGEITFYAAVREGRGEEVCLAASVSYSFDFIAPEMPTALTLEGPTTSPGTDSTPTLRVSGVEGGATVALYSDSSCVTKISDSVEVAADETSVSLTSYDLKDGTQDVRATFYAAQTDRAGNKSPCWASISYTLDITAPLAPRALTLEEPNTSLGNDSTPTLRVSGVEGGATVALYSDSSCDTKISDSVEVAADETSVSLISYDLKDGTQDVSATFYAAQTDRVGNKSLCSASISYTLDITAPLAPGALTLEEPNTSLGNDPTPTLSVSGVEGGATVALYSDSSCVTKISDSVEVAADETSVSLISYDLKDGTQDVSATFYAAQIDRVGNKSPCSASISYVLDITAPLAPGALTLEEPNTSPGNDPTPTLSVSGVEGGATVALYSDSSCDIKISDSVEVAVDETSASLISYDLKDGTQDVSATFYAAQTDRAGNKSLCSASISYVLDITAPARPIALNLEEPTTRRGTDPTPTLSMRGVEEGAMVTLYSDSSCTTKLSNSVEVAANQDSISITSYNLENGHQDVPVNFFAAQRDRAGNKSPCSTRIFYVLDVTAPAMPTALALEEPSTSPGIDATPTLRVSGVEGGASVTLYSDSSCDTQASNSVQVARGRRAVSITGHSLGDGTQDIATTFYALQIDSVGHKSACSTVNVSYVLDLTPPAIPTALALEEPSTNPGTDSTPTLRVSGVEAGAIVTLYSDSSCSTAVSSAKRVTQGQSHVLITSNDLGENDVTIDYYAAQKDIFERSSGCSGTSVSYGFIAPLILSEVNVETGSYFYHDPSHDTLEISVIFNKGVKVSGTPRLVLTIGTATRYATNVSGTGSSTLTFSYDISSDDYDSDGIEIVESIDLSGGTIKDNKNQNAVLTFSAPDNLGRVWINFEERIFSTSAAFAFLKKGGAVVTWGYPSYGGSSYGASFRLQREVEKIFSNDYAFAALKEDGSVVTWGSRSDGGDSDSVSSSLDGEVEKIFSNRDAFAALKSDGSVVTWGKSSSGGDSRSVSSDLTSDVAEIFSNNDAFAALKSDGSVVTWGNGGHGGDSRSVSSDLTSDVVEIFPNDYAFAALKEGGSVVTWGDRLWGGSSDSVSSKLQGGVEKIFSNDYAFAALKEGGFVVTWGASSYGGDSNSVSSDLAEEVVEVFSTGRAFAALKDDGPVVTWGDGARGGDSRSVSSDLAEEVVEIFSNDYAFAAIKDNGSVVTWGDQINGGNSSSVSSKLQGGVEEIYSTQKAFAALKDDGSVVTWGKNTQGGNSNKVSSHLAKGVMEIFSTGYGAFAALKDDGSVIIWGNPLYGGKSSGVNLGSRW